jgi:hypothetical protein
VTISVQNLPEQHPLSPAIGRRTRAGAAGAQEAPEEMPGPATKAATAAGRAAAAVEEARGGAPLAQRGAARTPVVTAAVAAREEGLAAKVKMKTMPQWWRQRHRRHCHCQQCHYYCRHHRSLHSFPCWAMSCLCFWGRYRWQRLSRRLLPCCHDHC